VTTTPQPEPVIQQHAVTPPGNIPKGRQTYIMIGVAVVIVLAIVFSGSATTAKIKADATLPPLAVATPSKRDIDGYSAELKAAEEQAKIAQAKLAATPTAPAPVNTGRQGGITGQGITAADGTVYYPAQQTNVSQPAPVPVNAIAQEKQKMEFTSLFSSPMALSLRTSTTGPPASLTAIAPAAPEAPVAASEAPSATFPVVNDIPQHTLFEGTVIESVLTNRLTGSFSGPVNCMVTTNVYSHDHGLLIIPQGSRVLGEAKRVAEQNQQRLAVTFHRLIMPDGYSVNLDQFPGLDQPGATGLKDQTNNHYLQVFGTSIALGALAGFSQFGTGSALTAGGLDSYRQGVASQVSQNSTTVLQRQLNRLPDITIREGQRVRIYLTKDLELPAYAAHEEIKR